VTQRPQFFINMEIERYTLATGETALTGFSRYWRHWGLFFAVLTFLANAWPGWITSSATMVTFFFDGGGNVKLLAILGLASIAIALTLTPVVYTVVQRVEFFKVGLVILFMVVAVAFAVTAEAWGALPDAVTNFGRIPEGLPWPWSCPHWPSPGPAAARTWSRATGCGTRATAWASTSPTWPADPDQQAVAAAVGAHRRLPDRDHGLVGAAVRLRLGGGRPGPVGQPQGAARPLARTAVYRFLLTVIIALVIWMLLAGLAALLGFL
jgi:hypothetical protein